MKEELGQLAESYMHLVEIAQSRKVFSCLLEAPFTYLSNIRDIYQEGLTLSLIHI